MPNNTIERYVVISSPNGWSVESVVVSVADDRHVAIAAMKSHMGSVTLHERSRQNVGAFLEHGTMSAARADSNWLSLSWNNDTHGVTTIWRVNR